MAGYSENKRTECTPCKCLTCRSEDHLIENFLKPPKKHEKRKKQVRFSETCNIESPKEYSKGKDNNDQNICASKKHMSDNYECSSRDFGDNSQLTNWILNSGETCHMMPQVSNFIPGY